MIALWVVVLVAGIVVTALASRRAVAGALEVAESLGASTGLIGVTLVAVGTDLPEIANSIVASISGHGDLVVGDATGSALTQVTLILAILLVAAPSLSSTIGSDERLVAPAGALTVVATVVIAIAIADGYLSRADGVLLVVIWVASMALIRRIHRPDKVDPDDPPATTDPRVARRSAAVLAWLALVGAAATAVVQAFVRITDALEVPQLIASTIVLAIGTSLPELVVDLTAIRRGAAALAIGDLFGSSLVDTTLSIGIGPVINSTAVSPDASTSVLIVAVAIAAATIAWYVGPRQRYATAAVYLGIYVIAMGSIVVVLA